LQLEEQIKEKNVLLQNEPKEELQQWKNAYQNYSQNIILINNLCWDYWKFQLEEKQLEEEEKMITILYWVLSKELLLYVLWEYLPSLSDIINNYLSSVVDYQISIKLNENLEKLELETKILDEKWERDVKSLSGGQRTILKLVWMLAISSYLRTEMLFLDETVNNLDGETVWKVTQLLDNFVKQRRMKFYTITHNSEIQWMKIWNSTLEIWKMANE
jgi:DNA repair exonuclease SbcCD ATPase subunit